MNRREEQTMIEGSEKELVHTGQTRDIRHTLLPPRQRTPVVDRAGLVRRL